MKVTLTSRCFKVATSRTISKQREIETMPQMLSTVYDKLHGMTKQAYQAYWTSVGYSGYLLDELCVLESAKYVKQDILRKVASTLQGEYKTLDSLYVDTVIATTLCGSGFLLTSMEALDRVNHLVHKLMDYKLLATHISPVTIKERIKKITESEQPGLDIATYLANKTLNNLLRPTYKGIHTSVPDRFLLTTPLNSVAGYIEPLYRLFSGTVYECFTKGFSRNLIFQTVRSQYYLYLKGCAPLSSTDIHIPVLKEECTKEEASTALYYLAREVTANYYEPLMYTRIQGINELLEKMQSYHPVQLTDVHNVTFLEYGDVYSKVVRIGNIRRRLIIQDVRYLISEAVASAFRKIVREYEK